MVASDPRPPSPRNPRRHRLSESVAKARIRPELRKGIVDIPGFSSRLIPARGAFATDSDTTPPRSIPEVPPISSQWRHTAASPDGKTATARQWAATACYSGPPTRIGCPAPGVRTPPDGRGPDPVRIEPDPRPSGSPQHNPISVFHRFDGGAGVGDAGAAMVRTSAPRPRGPVGTPYLSERVPQRRWFSMLHTLSMPSPKAPPSSGGSPARAGARRWAVRRRAAVRLAAAAAALVLAACSTPHAPTGAASPTTDLEAQVATANDRRQATADASAAQAATAAASAVAALSPEERALRDTALATPEPQRPAEADQHNLTGAIAVAEYFITLYPYVYATGDLTAFRAMSDATCKFCDSVINNTTSMHTAGGWEDPWEHHTTFTSITADISTPNRYVVEFHVVSDEHVSHSIGEPPQINELIQGPVLVQVLWKDGTGWIIEGVDPQ